MMMLNCNHTLSNVNRSHLRLFNRGWKIQGHVEGGDYINLRSFYFRCWDVFCPTLFVLCTQYKAAVCKMAPFISVTLTDPFLSTRPRYKRISVQCTNIYSQNLSFLYYILSHMSDLKVGSFYLSLTLNTFSICITIYWIFAVRWRR